MNRKLLVLCIFLLLGSACCLANAIRPKAFAEEFARRTFKTKSTLEEVLPNKEEQRKELENIHIYRRLNGGFVIVSDQDGVQSILGFSKEGNIDSYQSIPQAMKEMLQNTAYKLRTDSRFAREIKDAGLRVTSEGEEMVLKTANWEQAEPFCQACPFYANVGSIPIAAAIIMRYHQYPKAASGVIDSYSYTVSGKEYTVPKVIFNHPYDWSNMPDDSPMYTNEKVIHITKLLYEVGAMAKTKYSPSSSNADEMELLNGMIRHMHYSKDSHFVSRRWYNDSEWFEMIRKYLREVGPLYYSGNQKINSTTYTAFVVDGYGPDNYFHINWGTGKGSQGFFLLSKYSMNQHALINLRPDEYGTSQSVDALALRSKLQSSLQIDNYKSGTQFKISTTSLRNEAYETFSGYVVASLFNRNGEFKENISEKLEIELKPAQTMQLSINAKISGEIQGGDYVCLKYKGTRCEEERILHSSSDAAEDSFVIKSRTYPASELQKMTHFKLSKDISQITISFDTKVTCSIIDEKGGAVYSRKESSAEAIMLNTVEMRGTYTMSVCAGEDPFSFTFKL
ncbi:MAG: C10 family peptidase [Alistipes sp.]|nr:C10 family peptidase [Candidatus Alistipes equi]